MNSYVIVEVINHIGHIVLDRPKALNSLSLDMIRGITATLRSWHNDPAISAVFIHSSSEKAFCAGGDIRFFYDVGTQTPTGGSALLEDFFTEEYALNHLIHFYPKPYVALMNGVVMGGGMGIAQSGIASRLRIVTERTKMAMPEVNIGLFPDVGGGYFLNQTPGAIGRYLGLTGEIIQAADAIYANLADVYIPSTDLPSLMALITHNTAADLRVAIRAFAANEASKINPNDSQLALHRAAIDKHFSFASLLEISHSLEHDDTDFSRVTLATMQKRSPLLMAVTLEQLRRCKDKSVADCLRIERTMVRHCFNHGEVLEGVRALVVDKDNAPRWSPPTIAEVTTEMIEGFFADVWPVYSHPLMHLP
jgi:enoyl-CoA hydratase/carnithine racemase